MESGHLLLLKIKFSLVKAFRCDLHYPHGLNDLLLKSGFRLRYISILFIKKYSQPRILSLYLSFLTPFTNFLHPIQLNLNLEESKYQTLHGTFKVIVSFRLHEMI